MPIKRKMIIIACVGVTLFAMSIPELVFKEKGESNHSGTYGGGTLYNSHLIPYCGDNYEYFSFISYFLMDNGYMHSKMKKTLIDAFKTCEKTCPEINFRIMECSNKHGGKMNLHRTHQIGLSVDCMVVKKNKSGQSNLLDGLGLAHYLLSFSDNGKFTLYKTLEIDFETCAKHILAMDDAAQNNGLRIKKVIFKLELIDDLLDTEAGKEIQKRNIYFAKWMPELINNLHDDHYHVDFE